MPNRINATTELMTTTMMHSTENTAHTLRMITMSLLPLSRVMAFSVLLSVPDCSSIINRAAGKENKENNRRGLDHTLGDEGE
ncbi:hypothetical protein [Sodalis-like endosymbiont of Proechinophthirus fluctus]|uniref:hypothetical protein n=1 Tax=Sodalis-like endosymbiont of Proechinophthirus fluctus TaxID=1462730 RepID=UPI001650BAB7|nr:hypothetical protein [Sodalis-like endosymbiont of Proechinophthirus fluctus]